MPNRDLPAATPRVVRSRLQRWLLAGLGVLCVGLAALGVLLPGLPTTVFLIVASWCFARSCPWLEERLVRVPLFRPFLGFLDGGARMPLRAVVLTLLAMWTAITISCGLLLAADDPRPVVAAIVVAAGLVGTFFVVRLRDGGRLSCRPQDRRTPAVMSPGSAFAERQVADPTDAG